VNFTVSGAGILSASGGLTDASGQVSVILTGNNLTSGDQTATVTATASDGRTGSVSVIVTTGATPTPTPTPTSLRILTLQVVGQPIPPFLVSLSGAPPGGPSVTIRATATTNGIADVGLPVTFAINAASTGTGNFSSNPVNTGAGGIADVIFTATSAAGTTVIIDATMPDGRNASLTLNVIL
jgi:hypothetical protein